MEYIDTAISQIEEEIESANDSVKEATASLEAAKQYAEGLNLALGLVVSQRNSPMRNGFVMPS